MSEVQFSGLPLKLYKRGKVRDVYDLGEKLLIVSSDRISAFDFVLPSLIPDKGKVLNRLAIHFFDLTRNLIPNHMIDALPEVLPEFSKDVAAIEKRSVIVRKVTPFPLEAIVRGFLVGSGWASYQKTGMVCGERIKPGLMFAERLPVPLFTPSTKAESGHDENISMVQLQNLIGSENAGKIRDLSLKLFRKASEYAFSRGIIIADSKFEFGRTEEGAIILIDEIFTPDSSRFWKREEYKPGEEPPSYDKQYVRNHLLHSSWDRQSIPPPLPDEIIRRTREKYLEIYEILTGRPL